jgi:hypothetical protein
VPATAELFGQRRCLDTAPLLAARKADHQGCDCRGRLLFRDLDLSQHPDKTFIGRIDRGFDFLGYHFSRDADGVQALGLAAVTVAKFKEKLFRLYEQARRATASARSGRPRGTEPSTSDAIAPRINNYERRWLAWARGGLNHASSRHLVPDLAIVHCLRGRDLGT